MNVMKKVWIIVLVKRGCIEEPEIFHDEITALKRKRYLLRSFNRDYDEIDIFEKQIDV